MLGLSGCATLNERELATLERQRVPARLQDRMEDGRALTTDDVIELSRRRVSPDLTIRYLRRTNRIYRLNSREVARLQKARVDPQVIDYMLATPAIYARAYDPGWGGWGGGFGGWGGWGYGGWAGYQPWWGGGPGMLWGGPVFIGRGRRGCP